jgi:RNA polymerase sigma-70 factor (sigma-E family)
LAARRIAFVGGEDLALGTSRDPALFAEFVAVRSMSLLRTAHLLVGDYGLAQDLVQEALVKTYEAWGRLEDPGNAEAYTRQVMVRTVVSWRRRRSFQERPSDPLPEGVVADPTQEVVDRDAVWRELQSLPARQRAALVLRFYEDLSDAQAAELLGCRAATVRSQVSQGLRRLRGQVSLDRSVPSPDGGRSADV